jgi:hypothetical protein
MSIEYRRGGRKVSQQGFWDGLTDELIKEAEDSIEARLKSVCDPSTGQPIRVKKVTHGGETNFELEGSPEAIDEAKCILGGQL